MHPGNIIVHQKVGKPSDVRLSFIDAGLVVTLNKVDRKNFIDLFKAVVMNDGKEVGRLMMERSSKGVNSVKNPSLFVSEINDVVNSVHSSGLSLGNIGIGSLLTKVLQLCFVHQVKLEARYVSVIVALGVLEGLGRQLDPDIDILKLAVPYVLHAAASYSLSSLSNDRTKSFQEIK
jgi:aarF domain-containing kinase